MMGIGKRSNLSPEPESLGKLDWRLDGVEGGNEAVTKIVGLVSGLTLFLIVATVTSCNLASE